MLTGFPPKSVDLADMDLSIVSAGIKSGDTLIFEIVKKSAQGSAPSATPAKSDGKENMAASESKPSSAGSASSSMSSSAPRANTSSSMSSSSAPTRANLRPRSSEEKSCSRRQLL